MIWFAPTLYLHSYYVSFLDEKLLFQFFPFFLTKRFMCSPEKDRETQAERKAFSVENDQATMHSPPSLPAFMILGTWAHTSSMFLKLLDPELEPQDWLPFQATELAWKITNFDQHTFQGLSVELVIKGSQPHFINNVQSDGWCLLTVFKLDSSLGMFPCEEYALTLTVVFQYLCFILFLKVNLKTPLKELIF